MGTSRILGEVAAFTFTIMNVDMNPFQESYDSVRLLDLWATKTDVRVVLNLVATPKET